MYILFNMLIVIGYYRWFI